MTVDKSDRQRALRLTPVSRETEERLAALVAELERWQAAKNLVSSATLGDVWTRHIADSLQLFNLASEREHWLDLGSGGGFPGLVIGIAEALAAIYIGPTFTDAISFGLLVLILVARPARSLRGA